MKQSIVDVWMSLLIGVRPVLDNKKTKEIIKKFQNKQKDTNKYY